MRFRTTEFWSRPGRYEAFTSDRQVGYQYSWDARPRAVVLKEAKRGATSRAARGPEIDEVSYFPPAAAASFELRSTVMRKPLVPLYSNAFGPTR